MDDHVIKTYRYLRLSMVLLVVALGAAVLVEWWQVGGDCFQSSISAYYYTSARGVFVGALVAIGVGMVAIKGNTEWEDTLLNLAGMLAPVVALVPTAYEDNCFSVRLDDAEMRANVENNVAALIVVGVVGLVLATVFWLRSTRERKHLVGLLVAGAVLVVGTVAFVAARELFLDNGHYVAAFGMFGLIVVVAFLNARGSGRMGRNRYRNVYLAVSALMAAALVIGLVLGLAGVEHVVLVTEVAIIALFVVFWVTQTKDLWDYGNRQELEQQRALT